MVLTMVHALRRSRCFCGQDYGHFLFRGSILSEQYRGSSVCPVAPCGSSENYWHDVCSIVLHGVFVFNTLQYYFINVALSIFFHKTSQSNNNSGYYDSPVIVFVRVCARARSGFFSCSAENVDILMVIIIIKHLLRSAVVRRLSVSVIEWTR